MHKHKPLFFLIVFALAVSSLSFARDNEDSRDIKHVPPY